MDFKYFEINDKNNLVNKLYELSCSKEDLPFTSIILPLGFSRISYISNNQKISIFKSAEEEYEGLIITGQHYRAYDLIMKSEGVIYGIEFHPTALYKIFKTDISTLTNKHLNLCLFDKKKSKKFMDIFLQSNGNEKVFIDNTLEFLNSLTLTQDKDIEQIDKAVDFIFEKEGMLQISDLLKVIPFSQKTLETKFKKIIGFTPGKYIRLIRFSSLMRKYEAHNTEVKTLMYDYNYYDESHFKKEFKQFLNKTPSAFFREDYPRIKKYLK